jgi:tripartite-type tricarboxylate transporter receptor subunit TctC
MRALFILFLLCFQGLSFGQSWPNHPVKIIVPFSAGGNTDSIARITAEELTKTFGQTFIVENKPGANGAIAANFVAKAPADGYTLLLAVLPQMAVLPAMTKTAYDPVKDFSLISIIASNEFALTVANNFPAKNFDQLQKYGFKNRVFEGKICAMIPSKTTACNRNSMYATLMLNGRYQFFFQKLRI